MLLRFFYLDESSQLCYYEKEEIYSLKLNDIEMNGEAGVNLLNYDFVINNTSKINLRLSIDYTAFLYQEENIEYITEFQPRKSLMIQCTAAYIIFCKEKRKCMGYC